MKTVKNLMTTNVKTVTLQDNIYEAAVIMAENDVGFVPVVDVHNRTQLIAVLTDRDLVVRGYAQKHSGSTAIEKVISDTLITVSPNDSIDEAADLMAHYQVRRLPVVDNGNLVGVIALGDIAVARKKQSSDTEHALHDISMKTTSTEQQRLM